MDIAHTSKPRQNRPSRPVIVVKVGGAFIDAPDKAALFFDALKAQQQDHHIVLVHGGGNHVQRLMDELNLDTQKVDGLRVTPQEHLPYVVGALAGTANKSLVALARQSGMAAVGISLADGNMTTCQQFSNKHGAVGTVMSGNKKLLQTLCSDDFFPIVSSIGCSAHGALLNVNADDAAVAVASVLNARLLLLSDVEGVLDNQKMPIRKLNQADIQTLIEQGVIRDGMAVKVNAALNAAKQLGQPVTIGSWQAPNIISRSLDKTAGTTISPH
ncbi:acetylglutamate kinase [Aestuariibacter sp. AA17]|uniref:Acetylglutamate kinase n=1 Tax=Fluctibacter corallii TaxID=2984329 RepID=A0ABT3A6W6_9ALTE|nr:acetylglutamate kinase [Aestuariibacter sp. AA17]MCV2884389.1 acetylglutamate kinase [Aestuariibacter sp. AA17]